MNKLDINSILKSENNNPVKIGELNQDIINKLNLSCKPRNIILEPDRIYHCEKHKSEYKSDSSYNNSLINIPNIISSPDYIGFNENHNSLLYVKKLEDTTLVAIRIYGKNTLKLRTMFPVTDFYLNSKLKSKRIIPYNLSNNK